MRPQITVLDAGGQYCHLIARKVRDLGVYAEVAPSETPAGELAGRKGVIISGGPSSVYDPGSPTIDPQLLHAGIPVLGICYGQQLMAHLLGGRVERGDRGEYGFAQLDLLRADGLFKVVAKQKHAQSRQVWMSHPATLYRIRHRVSRFYLGSYVYMYRCGDGVIRTRAVCGPVSSRSRAHALWHPDPIELRIRTPATDAFKDWGSGRAGPSCIEDQIRAVAKDRNIFFFVSGGVDSDCEAYTLCLRALAPERVHGTYVDTGMMREGETEFVRANFAALGARAFAVEDAASQVLRVLLQLLLTQKISATSSAKNSCECSSGFSSRSIFSTGSGFSARAQFTPTPSSPGAQPKPI